MSNSDIIAGILANPSKHLIDRDELMQKTAVVLNSNAQKKVDEKSKYLAESTGDIQLDGAHFGYSNKRKQGD